MSEALANALDLGLAWARLKFDRPDRVFLTDPFQEGIAQADLEGFLGEIRQRVVAGYAPSGCLVCPWPKGNWQLRPGAALALDDEVLLNALSGLFYPQIEGALRWAQGNADISYQLVTRHNATRWVHRGFPIWRQWREKSIELLRPDVTHVLFVDIANFYENIDLRTLGSDLAALDTAEHARNLLIQCLYRWADSRGRGVPQGYTAVDILAKVYLHSIDQTLQAEGYSCLRYVDDLRIFCTSELDCRRALARISELLRLRGLNVHSTKTFIATREKALEVIDGITPIVEQIAGELAEEVRALAGAGYGTVADLERLTAANADNAPREVLETAFTDQILAAAKFNKTLFHYVLTRLAATGSDIALDYCLDALGERPEETDAILKYLSKFNLTEAQHAQVFDYLESPTAIYDYQAFAVLRHYYEHRLFPVRCIAFARTCVRDAARPIWVKSYAAAILGDAGTAADWENLRALYDGVGNVAFQSVIICSCRRIERGRRNAWYGHLRNEGAWQRRAVAWAQANGG
jgi:hypothetical protein